MIGGGLKASRLGAGVAAPRHAAATMHCVQQEGALLVRLCKQIEVMRWHNVFHNSITSSAGAHPCPALTCSAYTFCPGVRPMVPCPLLLAHTVPATWGVG